MHSTKKPQWDFWSPKALRIKLKCLKIGCGFFER